MINLLRIDNTESCYSVSCKKSCLFVELGAVQCGQGGRGLQMRTSALFGAKNFFGFFWNLWCVRTIKGCEPVRTFFGKRGGVQFFAIVGERLLWTAPSSANEEPLRFLESSYHPSNHSKMEVSQCFGQRHNECSFHERQAGKLWKVNTNFKS